MITNPKFVVLYAENQQRVLDFCTETLGFEVQADAAYGESSRWIEVRIPEATTYLVIAEGDPEVRGLVRRRLGEMSHVWFDCDDLDATFTSLAGRGVRFPVEPQPAPWDPSGQTRWAQFADPEGTLYGLTQRGA
ncbi:putative glyoxalase superfamily protein PhnB [Actinopolyspora biskrensis]|uniref:Putative glyoxalase superfamily protein PhnB n=1 Tax=Actinopolyspora biskrensis TaxID=1470178 RepID=A0A852YSV7_9ACTN|nr:VOC family protein [Actinopolyspora biskrensis]NYH77008.1 putative glyoxalase superfamily protein PhnB [Actinopolyspora biskrensis]